MEKEKWKICVGSSLYAVTAFVFLTVDFLSLPQTYIYLLVMHNLLSYVTAAFAVNSVACAGIFLLEHIVTYCQTLTFQ